MRFRDGMWLVAADKRVEYAESIYSASEREDSTGFKLLCPTKQIRSRGDTLNCGTLTIDIQGVDDGIISVEVAHWTGARRRRPNFELFPAQPRPSYQPRLQSRDGKKIVTAGSISAEISMEQFAIHFHEVTNGRAITSLQTRSVGFAYCPAFINEKFTEDASQYKHYVFTQTDLGIGETIHGLGERFSAFNKVGQSVAIWNDDGGTSSEQAYKNIPFWLSSADYGVFIDTPDRIELEIGSERSCRLQTSVEGQRLKWFIIHGNTPKQILSKYTKLTGRSCAVPAWSFGLWLTTSFTTSYDETTVNSFLEGMKARNIPLEVFHFDCFWLRPFHWCDFVFAPEFPEPQAQIERLKQSKLANKICVWINPYLGQASPLFEHAASKGYLLKRTNGDVWQWDLWQAGMGLVDFTNPEAVVWYSACLRKLFLMGVDCLKTDFGERIPTQGIRWHDSSLDPSRMHNFYAYLYNKIVFEAVEGVAGRNNAVLFARAATAGTQQYPLVWGGDCESTFVAMAESIRGGLSLGLCGFSYWSNDIGGFEGTPDAALYKRWVAFGMLCSHSRLHGSNSYRVPWEIDGDRDDAESCTAVLRLFVLLKRRLMPYLYAQAVQSSENGWPLSLRAMAFEFPEDPTSWYVDRQFMVGSSLLAAPVMSGSGEVQVYLPPGRWTNWWDGSQIHGPRWVKQRHGYSSLPMYVREGHAILLAANDDGIGKSFGYDWVGQGGEIWIPCPDTACTTLVVDHHGSKLGQLRIEQGVLKDRGGLSADWVLKSLTALSPSNSSEA